MGKKDKKRNEGKKIGGFSQWDILSWSMTLGTAWWFFKDFGGVGREDAPRGAEPPAALTADAKFSRDLRFVVDTSPTFAGSGWLVPGAGAGTGPNTGMAGLRGLHGFAAELDLPQVPLAHYRPSDISAIEDKLARIEAQFGPHIRQAASLTRVPADLIRGFLYVESEGDPKAFNSRYQATGLMQLTPPTPPDLLYREFKKGRITAPEKAVLDKYLSPAKLQTLLLNTPTSKLDVATMFHPELNILLGAMLMGQLLDEHYENGTYRLDKVIARYNAGYYFRSRGKNLTGSMAQLYTTLPAETKSYVRKLLGPNGILSVLADSSATAALNWDPLTPRPVQLILPS